jgi:membrane protease YdiL (CAAX protease family)
MIPSHRFADSTSQTGFAGLNRPDSSCGVLEAILWTGGFLFAQALLLIALLAVLVTAGFGLSWPGTDELTRWFLDLELDRSFLLVAAPVLGMVFLMLPLIRWREGKNFRERIGWNRPSSEELIFSLATVTPIAVIGNVVYDVANSWWCGDAALWPFASAIRKSSLENLYETFQGVPYPVLIVAMALAPAFVEELVFRGVLGRRLVGRFGLTRGVILSSVCFAVVHGSPPHVIATLPVAALLHLLYLATGTIWIPILVHFGNNLLSISLVHFSIGPETPLAPISVLGLSWYLGVMLFLLYHRTDAARMRSLRLLPGMVRPPH